MSLRQVSENPHLMKKTAAVAVSAILASAVTFAAISPAWANAGAGTPVTSSGNTISWVGGAVAYNENFPTLAPDGNIVYLCKSPTNSCIFGGPDYLGEVIPQTGSTSITILSTIRISGGALLGAGTYTAVLMSYTRQSDLTQFQRQAVDDPMTIVVPEFVAPAPSSGSPNVPPAPAGTSEPAVGMALQASVGSTVEGTPVSFTGVAMKAGSTYVLQVNSEPVILATGTIAEGGRISGLPRLPALPPGTHTLRLTTTGSDGSSLTIAQVFVVGGDGRFVSISDPAGSVDHATSATRERLASTGVQSSVLPWWALASLLLGMLLVAYSIRADRMLSRPELAEALWGARTPWEILATPIRVPGIDYAPSTQIAREAPNTLGASIRELDFAISRVIAHQIERVGMPTAGR